MMGMRTTNGGTDRSRIHATLRRRMAELAREWTRIQVQKVPA